MRKSLFVLGTMLATMWSSLASAGLVNGNFDTGDFTGWSVAGDGIGIDTTFPNLPCCDAAFSALSTDPNIGVLSQSIATTPGSGVTIKFQLLDEAGSFGNTFTVTFGTFSQDITGDLAAFAYTPFSLSVPAADITDISTLLSFQGTNDQAAWNLDDVSVSPAAIPEPASLGIFGVALLGMFSSRRRVRRNSVI